MFMVPLYRCSLAALLVTGFSAALAQTGGATTPVFPQEFQTLKTAGYALSPVEDSGVSGSMQVTERAEGGTRVVVSLYGASEGTEYALVLFRGDCGPDRQQILQLTSVNSGQGDPNTSLTDIGSSYGEIAGADAFLYVLAGGIQGEVVACGEVGLGANDSAAPAGGAEGAATGGTAPTLPVPAPRAGTQTGGATAQLPPEALRSLRTLSYALSPVENSGVSGSLQVTERAEGGTRLTVSLAGADGASEHAVVLYRGDCGPDRPQELALQSVGAPGGSPNSSLTDAEFSFDTLTQGDYFLYVYQGPPGSAVLACGEVGQGASP